MKITKTTRITLALICLLQGVASAQDLQFSQFFQLPSIVNPAYVSVPSGVQLSLAHRRQWGRLQSGFQGLAADACMRIARAGRRLPERDIHTGLGMGIQVCQSKEPYFGYKEQEAALQVGAFVGDAQKMTLHLGLCGTFGRRSVDFDRMIFSGQLDPVFGISNPGSFVPPSTALAETFSVGGGLAVRGQFSGDRYSVPFSVGVALRQLAGSREVSFLGNPEALLARVLSVHASMSVPLSEQFRDRSAWYISPLARFDWAGYRNGHKPLFRGALGLMAQQGRIMLGSMIAFNRRPESGRNSSALMLMLGGNTSLGESRLSLLYHYEAPLQGLGLGASGGAHEISAVFELPGRPLFSGKNKRKQTDCFHFIGKGFWQLMN